MEEYLSGRRKGYEEYKPSFMESMKEKFSKIRMKRKVRDVVIEDDADIEETVEVTEETEEELDEPVSTPRRSLISWLFRRRPKYEEFDDEENEVMTADPENNEEDYREAIKILHKWVEKLDPHTLNQFKRSEDFGKYKEVLAKLKLIK